MPEDIEKFLRTLVDKMLAEAKSSADEVKKQAAQNRDHVVAKTTALVLMSLATALHETLKSNA